MERPRHDGSKRNRPKNTRDPRYTNPKLEIGDNRPARITAFDTQTKRKVQGRVDIRNDQGEVILHQVNPPREKNVTTPLTDPNKTKPLSETDSTNTSRNSTPGYRVIDRPIITDPNGRPIESKPGNPGYGVIQRPAITDQFGRPIESTGNPPQGTNVAPSNPEPKTTPETKPEPEKPKNTGSERPGYVSPYETPEEREARIKKTREEIGDINQLKPDGSNRERFNRAAFGYSDPKSPAPKEESPKTDSKVEANSSSNPETKPATETKPEPEKPKNTGSERPGYVSPYETPEEREARIKKTREEIGDMDREEFNYAAFAYRDPNSKEKSSDVNPKPTPEPEPVIPPIPPIEPEPRPNPEPEPRPTPTPELPVIEFAIDLAVVQLSPQEREEIIRERIRQNDEERERAAAAKGFFAGLRNAFWKEARKIEDSIALRAMSDQELFATSSADFKARKQARAEEIAQLSSETLFNEVATSKGFKELVRDTGGSIPPAQKERMVGLIKSYAKDLLTPTPPGPQLSRDAFERAKTQLLSEIANNDPELMAIIQSDFDNTWTKVQQVAERARSLSNAADVIDAMNIDLNVRFGRARLNHETEDENTLSVRLENMVVNSRFLSWVPLEPRIWLIAGTTVASNYGAGIARQYLGVSVPFLGPLVSGVVSGTMEYKRKSDEMTYTQDRITRMLAEGKDISTLMTRQNPREIAQNVSVEKVEDLRTNIENSYAAYLRATGPEKATHLTILIKDIARFRALLNVSTQRGVDLLGSSSAEQLIKDKAALTQRCNEILNQLQAAMPDTERANLKQTFNTETQNSIANETNLLENRERQARALRIRTSALSGVGMGARVAAFSIGASEILAFLDPNTQGAGEYALGLNNDAIKNSPLSWLVKTARGDTQGLHQMLHYKIPVPGQEHLVVHTDPNAPRGYEWVKSTVNVSPQDQLAELKAHSNIIHELPPRTYTGDFGAQGLKYGGHTRSFFTSDSSSVWSIFGRDELGARIGEHTVLHDFDASYLDAFKNGSFRAIVNLPSGEAVDVTNLLQLKNGVVSVDFAQEPGILGELFKNGSKEGMQYISNIQYGIMHGNTLDVVSTRSGGGLDFMPEGTTKEIAERVMNFGRTWTSVERGPDTLIDAVSLGDPKGIQDLIVYWFGPKWDSSTLREAAEREQRTGGASPAPSTTAARPGPSPRPTPSGDRATVSSGTGPTATADREVRIPRGRFDDSDTPEGRTGPERELRAENPESFYEVNNSYISTLDKINNPEIKDPYQLLNYLSNLAEVCRENGENELRREVLKLQMKLQRDWNMTSGPTRPEDYYISTEKKTRMAQEVKNIFESYLKLKSKEAESSEPAEEPEETLSREEIEVQLFEELEKIIKSGRKPGEILRSIKNAADVAERYGNTELKRELISMALKYAKILNPKQDVKEKQKNALLNEIRTAFARYTDIEPSRGTSEPEPEPEAAESSEPAEKQLFEELEKIIKNERKPGEILRSIKNAADVAERYGNTELKRELISMALKYAKILNPKQDVKEKQKNALLNEIRSTFARYTDVEPSRGTSEPEPEPEPTEPEEPEEPEEPAEATEIERRESGILRNLTFIEKAVFMAEIGKALSNTDGSVRDNVKKSLEVLDKWEKKIAARKKK